MVDLELEDITEESFIDFFRRVTVNDAGYEDAAEASPDDLLRDFLSPHLSGSLVIPNFYQTMLFNAKLRDRLQAHILKVDGRGNLGESDAESVVLYEHFVKFFNPDLVYCHFDRYERERPNLLVLERGSLNEDDKACLIQRGEKWLDVLYRVEQRKDNHFWGWRLSNRVEALVAKTNPDIDREFLYDGKVLKYDEGDPEIGTPAGLVVDGFSDPIWEHLNELTLVNVDDPERFGHLVGRKARYHYVNFVRALVGIPYGELIAVHNESD